MKNKKGIVWILSGLLLIAAALSLAVYNLYDEYRAAQSVQQVIGQIEALAQTEVTEQSAQTAAEETAAETEEILLPDYILNSNMEMPVENIKGKDYIGILEIPAFGLELPVISEWSYPNLKIAPCRYTGSAYTNDMVIAAHNYSTHFGNLKNLTEGDSVRFTDMDGNIFVYEVAQLETLIPTAVEEMTAGEWDLTLFTCTIGGSYRVTVRCELVCVE